MSDPIVFVYVGTYTSSGSEGIYRYRLLPDGALQPVGVTGGLANPSFLAIDATRLRLFAIHEVSEAEGRRGGAVSAFSIDAATGDLTLLNRQSTVGPGPCHVSVDLTGKAVLVANYGGGSVASFPVHDDGTLGEATSFIQHSGSSIDGGRQEGPHAHSIFIDHANLHALSPDLGIDRVLVYDLDAATATLTPSESPFETLKPGAGPRHLAFSPDDRRAYVINELDNTVTAFDYNDRTGGMKEFQSISTLPAGFSGESYCADILVHPNGRLLFGTNRGHDSVAIFVIDTLTGRLTAIGHEPTQGAHPRNFSFDPAATRLYVANQDSDNIVVFDIDPETDLLKPTGHITTVSRPVCVRFLTL